MTFAVIDNGVVANIVESNIAVGQDWYAVPINCPVNIGDTFSNGCFFDEEGVMREAPELSAATNRIAELETQNQALVEQNRVLTEQNDMLTACVLEMSELVYA